MVNKRHSFEVTADLMRSITTALTRQSEAIPESKGLLRAKLTEASVKVDVYHHARALTFSDIRAIYCEVYRTVESQLHAGTSTPADSNRRQT